MNAAPSAKVCEGPLDLGGSQTTPLRSLLRPIAAHLRRSVLADAVIAQEIWRLAWPAISRMLLVTFTLVATSVMMGRYGSSALASLQISASLTYAAYTLFTSFSVGTLSVVAHRVGAGDRRSAARAARASIAVALLVGLVVVVPIRVANGALLRLIFPKADPSVLLGASSYLHVVLPMLPLAFVEAVAAAALQGAGDTRTPLLAAVLGNAANGALSWVLIFGHLGAPRLGVRGAALGNAASMAIEAVVLVAVLLSRQSPLPVRQTPIEPREEIASLGRVLRVSAPVFGDRALHQAGYLAFIGIIGLLGATALAANQALLAIEAVCFLSADGLGVAAGALVAQKLGAGKSLEAARVMALATLLATVLLGVLGMTFLVAPRCLLGAFSSDPSVLAVGSGALLVSAAAQPFVGFATVAGMGLRGAGDTRTVLLVTAATGVVLRLAATYLFALTLGLGLEGVYLGSTADWLCRSGLLLWVQSAGHWKRVHV